MGYNHTTSSEDDLISKAREINLDDILGIIERLDEELAEAYATINEKDAEIEDQKATIRDLEEKISDLEGQLIGSSN